MATRVRTVTVVVKPHCVVYIEGDAYVEGQVIELPPAEASAELEAGRVEKA
jgi:hypothetical protein